jgi:hypothetical protein
MEDKRVAYRCLVEKDRQRERERERDLLVRDHLEDLDVDGRIILQQIVKTWDGDA